MKLPIMPIAICTISSECGWYMKVPLRRELELVDEGLAGIDVRLGEAADAVHAVGQHAGRANAPSCARAAGW